MTHFLVTKENPKGYKLEDLLMLLRKTLLSRALKIANDKRPEAERVMQNDLKILEQLSEAISLATESTYLLDRAFGPSKESSTRIGS